MNKIYCRHDGWIRRRLSLFPLALFLLVVSGCATTPLYTINIRYEPTQVLPKADGAMKKRVLTVAEFNDVRAIDDHLKIGYVLKSNGTKVYILPEKVKASEAVAAGVRDYFYQAGNTISGVRPVWDLQEKNIAAGWGDMVIGGVINKLEIICDDSQPLSPVRNYSAIVNLGITFADVPGKRIVYRTSAEGSASLTNVTFSPEKLQQQLNGVLSEVIEKLFTGQEFREQMRKVAAIP